MVVAGPLGPDGPEPLGVGPAWGGASPGAAWATELAASATISSRKVAINGTSLTENERLDDCISPPERIGMLTPGRATFRAGSLRRGRRTIAAICWRHFSTEFASPPVLAAPLPETTASAEAAGLTARNHATPTRASIC